MEGHQRVDHGPHGDEGEEGGGDAADAVAEVEQPDGQAAQDDGEVEPGEEGALVGEEDLGLDPGGEGDAFACYDCQAGFVSLSMFIERDRRSGHGRDIRTWGGLKKGSAGHGGGLGYCDREKDDSIVS